MTRSGRTSSFRKPSSRGQDRLSGPFTSASKKDLSFKMRSIPSLRGSSSLIRCDAMRAGVTPPLQSIDEDLDALGTMRGCAIPCAAFPDDADLPENQFGGRIESPARQEKIRRFITLDTVIAGVHTEVGIQAGFGRDAGQHPRRQTPPPD